MKRWILIGAITIVVAGSASVAFLSRAERIKARQFVKERELPAFGQAIVARLSLEVANYRRAGDAMLADGIIRDWILSGERDVPRLLSFMNDTRKSFGRELVDMSIVSDASETFYCTDGRVMRLSPEMKERDGWYYAYRAQTPSGNIDSWYNPETGVIGMYVNVPIRNDDGGFLGVAGGSINSDQFMETVRAIEREHSVCVYLFRADGEIVYASSRALVQDHSRSADTIWGEPILPTLMRSQDNQFGVVIEPNGPQGSLLWGGRIPEWDTFVVIERGAGEIRALSRKDFAKALAFEGALLALMIAVLLVSIAVVARRSLSEEQKKIAIEARLRAIVDGHSRLMAMAERLLSGMGEAMLAKNEVDLGGKDALAYARYLADSRVALLSLSSDPDEAPELSLISLAEAVAAVRGSYAPELSRRSISLVVKEIDRGLVARANEALTRLGLGELIGAVSSRVQGPAEFFLSISGTPECPCVDFAVPRADPIVREREERLPVLLFESMGARLRYLEVNENVGVYHVEFDGSAE